MKDVALEPNMTLIGRKALAHHPKLFMGEPYATTTHLRVVFMKRLNLSTTSC